MIGAVQIRGARSMLGWSVKELAERAGVHPNTVGRIERGEGSTKGTLTLLRVTLKAAGIEFLEGGGVRVREGADADQ